MSENTTIEIGPAEQPADTPPRSRCCEPREQAVCCEPSEKTACCPPAATGSEGCGCR